MTPDFSTLCWAWTLTRTDGIRIGFTDHDCDLHINDVIHTAGSGLTPQDLDRKIGFASDNSAGLAMLTAEALTPEDIDAGLYDGAEVLIRRVNWRAPETAIPVWRGALGAMTRQGDKFTCEVSGETAQLLRSTGRVFSKYCDAHFGDARCGINITDFPQGIECPRTFLACRDQFSNSANFRGFPYLIGDDAMQASAETAASKIGGSRYGPLK